MAGINPECSSNYCKWELTNQKTEVLRLYTEHKIWQYFVNKRVAKEKNLVRLIIKR